MTGVSETRAAGERPAAAGAACSSSTPIPLSGGPGTSGWAIHAALLGAQAGFALFPILGKLALATMPPMALAAIRVAAAALLLEALRRLTREAEIPARDRPALFLYALLGVSFNQLLFILGLSLTTAINTSILTATIPVFTLAIAVLMGREKLTPRAAAGVVLASAGVLVLLDVTHFDLSSRYLRGNLLILANSFSYSGYLVLSRPLQARYSATTIVSRLFLFGAPVILLAAAPALLRFSPNRVTVGSWGSLAAIILFCTVLPYVWNSWALGRTDASMVAFYVFLQPLIASALAVLILRERLETRTAAAAALIFAGLLVTLGSRRRRRDVSLPALPPEASGPVREDAR